MPVLLPVAVRRSNVLTGRLGWAVPCLDGGAIVRVEKQSGAPSTECNLRIQSVTYDEYIFLEISLDNPIQRTTERDGGVHNDDIFIPISGSTVKTRPRAKTECGTWSTTEVNDPDFICNKQITAF
jgi:hypothetical protein